MSSWKAFAGRAFGAVAFCTLVLWLSNVKHPLFHLQAYAVAGELQAFYYGTLGYLLWVLLGYRCPKLAFVLRYISLITFCALLPYLVGIWLSIVVVSFWAIASDTMANVLWVASIAALLTISVLIGRNSRLGSSTEKVGGGWCPATAPALKLNLGISIVLALVWPRHIPLLACYYCGFAWMPVLERTKLVTSPEKSLSLLFAAFSLVLVVGIGVSSQLHLDYEVMTETTVTMP